MIVSIKAFLLGAKSKFVLAACALLLALATGVSGASASELASGGLSPSATVQPGDLFPDWTMDGVAAASSSIGSNEMVTGFVYIVLGIAIIGIFWSFVKRLAGRRR